MSMTGDECVFLSACRRVKLQERQITAPPEGLLRESPTCLEGA